MVCARLTRVGSASLWTALSVALLLGGCLADAELAEDGSAARGDMVVLADDAAAPAWAVPYGEEF